KAFSPADVQSFAGSSSAELLQIFDGAENDDNAFGLGILLAPPDTDGDVGPNHYVQMTNLVTTIFDKSGNVVLGPFANNVFWSGLGGLCETTNRGDPVVLYDEETDSWLVSQFGIGATLSLCIALSTTSDPTGTYFQHEFDFTAIGFPDYPKYGFVTDAIGVMANLFSPFQGAGLGAIDKAEASSPRKTTMVFFKLGANEFGFLPGDNDGPVFDNMPPTFATNNDGTGSTIDIWEIDVDFKVPANATVSEVASLPVSPIDGDLCTAFRERWSRRAYRSPRSPICRPMGSCPTSSSSRSESRPLMIRRRLNNFSFSLASVATMLSTQSNASNSMSFRPTPREPNGRPPSRPSSNTSPAKKSHA
ncbi:MAG: hypothetical protein IH831_08865, partial [Planctomycetes bacterium]|nr:hypothetical protein [Planctomycetota bacterium]